MNFIVYAFTAACRGRDRCREVDDVIDPDSSPCVGVYFPVFLVWVWACALLWPIERIRVMDAIDIPQ